MVEACNLATFGWRWTQVTRVNVTYLSFGGNYISRGEKAGVLEKILVKSSHHNLVLNYLDFSLRFTAMTTAQDTLSTASSHVLSDKSSPALSDESSSSSVDSSPKLNSISKMSGNPVSNVLDLQVADEKDAITLMSNRILEIIFDYALNKFDDCRDRLEAGRPRFIEVLNTFVSAGTKIDMALPAFPFKSANKVYKALGFLPDKAEEIALERLHNMCRRIEEIYEPGAKVIIISDGLVYNGSFHVKYLRHVLMYPFRLVEHIR